MKRLLRATLASLLLASCSPPTFRERGPQALDAGGGGERPEQRAWDRPLIVVSPPEVLAGSAARFRVIEHAAREASWLLVLGPEAGQPIEVRYRVADGLRLPIEAGEELWFNQSSRALGLAVRDGAGRLRVVIAVEGELAEVLDGTVAPSFDAERLVYTEVVALASGCMRAIDHHALELRQGGQRSFLAPGSVTRIALPSAAGDVAMDLYVLDVSRPTPRRQERDDPRCPVLAHTSWMALAAP